MATYGFRVHTIEPHVRRSPKEYLQIEDVSEAADDADALDAVNKQLIALQGITNVGTPTYFQSSDAEEIRLDANDRADDLPYFTVLRVDKAGRTLSVLVETGKEADHDALRGRDGKETKIAKRAPVRRSWVVLRFPKTGSAAFMISEVRGRSYAGDLLIAWLTRTAQRAVTSEDSKGNRVEEPWLNWKLTPHIDGERLDGILSGSADHTLKLKRRTVGAQGLRGSYDIELVQIGLKQTPVQKVLDVLVKMADRRSKGTESTRREAAAKDVLTLVDPKVAKVGGVGFTDGELSFLEKGKRQTINSETVDQLFVYPVASSRFSDARELELESEKVLERIAKGLRISLN